VAATELMQPVKTVRPAVVGWHSLSMMQPARVLFRAGLDPKRVPRRLRTVYMDLRQAQVAPCGLAVALEEMAILLWDLDGRLAMLPNVHRRSHSF
jgi:hypothetical protein